MTYCSLWEDKHGCGVKLLLRAPAHAEGTQGPELLRKELIHPLVAGASKKDAQGAWKGSKAPGATLAAVVTGMCEYLSLPFTCDRLQPDRHGPVLPRTSRPARSK